METDTGISFIHNNSGTKDDCSWWNQPCTEKQGLCNLAYAESKGVESYKSLEYNSGYQSQGGKWREISGEGEQWVLSYSYVG